MGGGARKNVVGCFPEEFQLKWTVVPLKNTSLFIANLHLNTPLDHYPLLTHMYTVPGEQSRHYP